LPSDIAAAVRCWIVNRHVFRIRSATIERGERLFDEFGAATIFFARFIFGLRVIAGPLAGVLRMPWKRFVLFNFLGALFVGERHLHGWLQVWKALGQAARIHQRLNVALAVVAALVIFFFGYGTGSAAAKPVAMERRACPPVGEQCFLFLRNLGRTCWVTKA